MVERTELEDRIEALEARISDLLLQVTAIAQQLETHLKRCPGATSTE